MDRIAIVYWSGQGSTKKMAEHVLNGIRQVHKDADVFTADAFGIDKMSQYDKIAFGCPAMGNEELEPSEFEPMFQEIEPALEGKKIVIFGSFGWGEQQWLKDWEKRCYNHGALLMDYGLAVKDEPDEEDRIFCEDLGTTLALA